MRAQCDLMCPFRLLVSFMAACLVPVSYPRVLVAAVNSLIWSIFGFLFCIVRSFYSVQLILIQVTTATTALV